MTIVFKYREEESEITGKILRPVASLEFKSRDGEWIEIISNFRLVLHGHLRRMFLLCLEDPICLIGLRSYLTKLRGLLYLRIKVVQMNRLIAFV